MELQGQRALVTGASRGIGAAIARELAAAGATVYVHYNGSADAAHALAAEIGGVAMQSELGSAAGCEGLLAQVASAGGASILVNNAGLTRDGLAMRLSDEQFEDCLQVDLQAPFRLSRGLLPAMSKARGGCIINIASVSALRANVGQAAYSAAKAGLLALTRSLAIEMGRRNIRVNAVAPGFVRTDMTAAMDAAVLDAAVERIPLRRLGEPEDIAPIVRFLCGPGGRYVTGQVLVVDGGLSI